MQIHAEDDVLVVAGQLDGRTLSELREALHEHLRAHEHAVVLDLSGVESVDLLALRMLAATTRVAARRGQRVALRGATPGVRRLLTLSHLRAHLVVEPRPVPA